MEKEEENTTAVMNDVPVRSKKHARLHRSFSHMSKALIKKLHVGGGHANANDKPSSPAASFLSGCMHPRTNSFASGRRKASASNGGREHDDGALAVDFRSLRLGAAAALADEGGPSSSSTQDYYTDEGGDTPVVVAGGGVAVVTFSAAPYKDFQRSMREMVDATRRDDDDAPAVDWELMEELLFCYLELNDRAVHGDILRAFTDTVAAIRRRRRAAGAKTRQTRRRQRPRRAREHDRGAAMATAASS